MFEAYVKRMKFLDWWCRQNGLEVFVKLNGHRHVVVCPEKRLRFEFDSGIVLDSHGAVDDHYLLIKVCDFILLYVRMLQLPGTFYIDPFGAKQRIRKVSKGMLYGYCDACEENNLEHYFSYQDVTLCSSCQIDYDSLVPSN